VTSAAVTGDTTEVIAPLAGNRQHSVNRVLVQIHYKNTFRDLVALCIHHYCHSPVTLVVYGICCFLMSLTNAQVVQSLPHL
jgi:hypothetical protein